MGWTVHHEATKAGKWVAPRRVVASRVVKKTASGAGRGLCRALHLLGEAGKRRRARNGKLRQALAIERDTGILQAVDQLPVGEAVLTRRGVDPDDPQPAKIPLLAAAADERVLECGVDRFFRSAIQ